MPPVLAAVFQHRSGRVVAFGRALLAAFFLVVIWADRGQPSLAVAPTYALLGAYALASAALLWATWNDWWLEAKLAAPAHGADMLVFLWLNFATQGYASPFFTFFAFLIFSGSIRWGWRGTVATAAVLIFLYVGSGVTAANWGTEAFDWRRFALRSAYLVVLTIMILLWLVATGHSEEGAERPVPPAPGDGPDLAPLLAATAAAFAAPRALCIWSQREEPWTYVSELEGGRFEERRLEPGRYEPAVRAEAGDWPFLFDQQAGHVLGGSSPRSKRARRVSQPVHASVARDFDVSRGLRIPVRSADLQGELLLLDVPGGSADDLERAARASTQWAATIEHRELMRAGEEAAGMRARLSLARDLHDSVAQLLAGLAFRLEGLKRKAGGGTDLSAQIDALQGELGREQQDLRRFIAELRGGPAPRPQPRARLVASLELLGARIGAQWGIACRVASADPDIEVPAGLEQNIHQLVREAAANAVRHGGADAVEVRLACGAGALAIEIGDNGSGFPHQGEFDQAALIESGPSSLRERVQMLGGRLRVASSAAGSRVGIDLPLEQGLPLEGEKA
jgi:signal transduction histidine kinase